MTPTHPNTLMIRLQIKDKDNVLYDEHNKTSDDMQTSVFVFVDYLTEVLNMLICGYDGQHIRKGYNLLQDETIQWIIEHESYTVSKLFPRVNEYNIYITLGITPYEIHV